MNNNNLNNRNYYTEKELKSFGIKKIGKNVLIEKSCRILGFNNISIGNNVRIDSFCNLIVHKGYLKISDNIHIGSFCHLVSTGGIEIQSFAGLSQGVKIYSASDDFSGKYMTNPTVNKKFTNVKIKKVIIKKHSIIGANSVILPGIVIEDGVAVGALSLVSKALKSWTIYSGVPARKVAKRNKNILNLEKKYNLFNKKN